MFAQLSSCLVALALLMVPSALAKTVRVNAGPETCIRTGSTCGSGMTLALADDGTPYANNPDSSYPVRVDAASSGQETIRCYWTGRIDDNVEEVTFTLSNSADYLDPCGNNHGITMVCNGPAATCQ